MDDRQFQELLDDLGYAFEGYRRVRKGVKKRIRRHMQALGCRGVADYRERIAGFREVRTACIRRMAVPISRFLRDRPLWEALEDVWLPDLRRRFGPHLNAWSAGCACGEEAYSLAMIDRESLARGDSAADFPMTVTATDLNPVVLAKARAGIYPASSLREVPADLAGRYFVPLRGRRRYCIRTALFDNIHWQRREIEAPLPERDYHLVLLRNNVLTYFDRPRQARALAHVVTGLHRGGLLAIGRRESLPGGAAGLTRASKSLPYLFRREPADDG